MVQLLSGGDGGAGLVVERLLSGDPTRTRHLVDVVAAAVLEPPYGGHQHEYGQYEDDGQDGRQYEVVAHHLILEVAMAFQLVVARRAVSVAVAPQARIDAGIQLGAVKRAVKGYRRRRAIQGGGGGGTASWKPREIKSWL